MAIQHLADEIAKARDLKPAQGLKAATESFASLFPTHNVDSPDQFVFKIKDVALHVGVLHLGIKRDQKKPYIYLYDLFINPDFRGKGYGKMAMKALEEKTRELGFEKIGLNVFGHNVSARALYEQMGYCPSSLLMAKHLAPS